MGHQVGITHGHETGWVAVPGGRQLMRRIAGELDVLTYISDYTRGRLEPALDGRGRLAQLSPGVDVDAFSPRADGTEVRRRHGLGDDAGRRLRLPAGRRARARTCWSPAGRGCSPATPVPGCCWSAGDRRRPRCGGPWPPAGWRTPSSSPGRWRPEQLPQHYAAGDVFAMPCRTRRGGLDVEGLGMVYLEAAACGLPVVAGTSGGAPEAVQDGVTGAVVADPRSPEVVADTVSALLDDPERARAMGAGGPGLGGAALVLDVDRRDVRRLLEPGGARHRKRYPRPAARGTWVSLPMPGEAAVSGCRATRSRRRTP